ncbi:hypothetical protein ACHAPJ_011969 [Fusarium lateritium]
MRLIDVETLRLKTFYGDNIPPYAILSHTWGADDEEITFGDIQNNNINKPGNGAVKLRGCCHQAKKDHLEYVWIDTCCINKESDKELSEAINSMFQWYKKASICYTYLSDVPKEDRSHPEPKFSSSRWFERGWTLQELLAPNKLRFYNQDWISIGTKADLVNEIQVVSGISRHYLLGWKDFRQASIAQRMSWAAKRKTSREEDIAYCLLGIFDVQIPMIYGEGKGALSRLQQEIIKTTGDQSILAWGLNGAENAPNESGGMASLSAGTLAIAVSDFAHCGLIVPRKQDSALTSFFDISGGHLRINLPLHETYTGETYGLLNCGPEDKPDQVVGVPIHKISSSSAQVNYFRPQGSHPILVPTSAHTISAKRIHIQMKRQNKTRGEPGRRLWLYMYGHQKLNIGLVENYPPILWDKERALIAEVGDSEKHVRGLSFTRFRDQSKITRDVIVVLEFDIHGSQQNARYHMMTLSKTASLKDLAESFAYLRPEALGKHAASIGRLNLKLVVNEEHGLQEPMFVIRLAQISSFPEATVDADSEMDRIRPQLELIKVLQEDDQIHLQAGQLLGQRDDKSASLNRTKERLAAVEKQIVQLDEEKRLLSAEVDRALVQVQQLTLSVNEARQQQEKSWGRKPEMRRHLKELEATYGPGRWLEAIIKTQLDTGKVGRRLDNVIEIGYGHADSSGTTKLTSRADDRTPLLWAATYGHEVISELLLESGASLEARDKCRNTPLMCAASEGHEAIVRQLLEKDANVDAQNQDGKTPYDMAIANGQRTTAALIKNKKASVQAAKKESDTRLISNRRKMPEPADDYDNEDLLSAAEGGDFAAVKTLLERGAKLEIKDECSNTPLLYAVKEGHEDVAKLLLKRGANIEARNCQKKTPLMLAATKSNEGVVRLLLDTRADIEAKDGCSNTPLLFAVKERHEGVARLLLEEGAAVNAADCQNATPLILAASLGDENLVRLLVEKGADTEAKNKKGNTPLQCAMSNKHKAVSKALIELGAKKSLRVRLFL